MTRSVLLAAAGALGVGATLAVTGEWPDPARSLDLATGRSVTAQTEVAFVAFLAWIAAVALMLNAAVPALRGRGRGRAVSAPLVVLVVGVALLVAGVAHHTGYRVCCATPATTQQAADLVR